MKKYLNVKIKFLIKSIFGAIFFLTVLLFHQPLNIQAETEDIILYQFHPEELESTSYILGQYYYKIYPNDDQQDYKKFLKYTYKISDDSVIGLKINGDIDFNSGILMADKNGNVRAIHPYDVKVYALGPGTATLKVYNGKKLIDTFKFTVVADSTYSLSSFVNNTDVDSYKYNDKLMAEIKRYAKIAANSKYTTTNQRILAVLNALIEDDCKLMSEKEYNKWYRKIKYDDTFTYRTAYSRLFDGKAIAGAFASVNKAVLSNLGLQCVTYSEDYDEACNTVYIYKKDDYYKNDIYPEINQGQFYDYKFVATTKLTSDYDFTAEDEDSIYKRTHLPAWIIGKDTSQQVVNVGQTIKLPSSDMNKNIFSSDTSVVKVENGKITGVKPGIAIVYRYNDTYCDMFYVLVKKQGASKTIQAKIYTKSAKSYFKTKDYAPYILGGQSEKCQIEGWENLRIYELESIFGHGGILRTKYADGKIECYLEYNGVNDLIYTVGTSGYAR